MAVRPSLFPFPRLGDCKSSRKFIAASVFERRLSVSPKGAPPLLGMRKDNERLSSFFRIAHPECRPRLTHTTNNHFTTSLCVETSETLLTVILIPFFFFGGSRAAGRCPLTSHPTHRPPFNPTFGPKPPDLLSFFSSCRRDVTVKRSIQGPPFWALSPKMPPMNLFRELRFRSPFSLCGTSQWDLRPCTLVFPLIFFSPSVCVPEIRLSIFGLRFAYCRPMCFLSLLLAPLLPFLPLLMGCLLCFRVQYPPFFFLRVLGFSVPRMNIHSFIFPPFV